MLVGSTTHAQGGPHVRSIVGPVALCRWSNRLLIAAADGTWFTPCATAPGGAKWWVTFTGASVQQADGAKASGLLATGERAFARLSAARTDEQRVGPGGPALLVRDILEIRAARHDDCAGK